MKDAFDKTNPVPSLPGSQWLAWLQYRPLRVGVLVGIYLTLVMVVALLLANRVPALEPLAGIRNAASYGLFAVLAAVPVWMFRQSPGSLFLASTTAWAVFSLMYALMGLPFENLFARLHKTPGNVFMLGAVVYGLLAVAAWVASMISSLLVHPIAASRRRP
jgi:hypothetical protein